MFPSYFNIQLQTGEKFVANVVKINLLLKVGLSKPDPNPAVKILAMDSKLIELYLSEK